MFRVSSYIRSAARASPKQVAFTARPCLRSHVNVSPVARCIRPYSLATDGTDISQKIDNISDSQYNNLASEYLETLGDDLENLSEEYSDIDAELNQGVMTVTIGSGKTYVINKQPPNKQIWLSSPISGPKRYDLIQGKWVTLRDNTSLTELLEEEFSSELGHKVQLNVEQ